MVESTHKDWIIKIISAFYPDAVIYLFGSYATGKQRPNSDYDIAIDVGIRLDIHQLAFLKNLLNALPTAQTIDLVDLNRVPEDMSEKIQKKGILWKS